jgi:hypothetical protein
MLLVGPPRPAGTARPIYAAIPSWTLVIFAVVAALFVRASYGYLLGRDPSVAFLFILVGIKFLETRTVRDGTLLVALASFLLVTPYFRSQSPAAALVALPALLVLGATLDALARSPASGLARTPSQALRRTGRMILQGIPIAAVMFVLFPRVAAPLWGMPSDAGAQTGLSDSMAPGSIKARLSPVRRGRVPRRLTCASRRPRSAYWRGPVLGRFDQGASGRWSRGPATERLRVTSARITYKTLGPHGKPWLFALDFPASLPRPVGEDADERQEAYAFVTRTTSS